MESSFHLDQKKIIVETYSSSLSLLNAVQNRWFSELPSMRRLIFLKDIVNGIIEGYGDEIENEELKSAFLDDYLITLEEKNLGDFYVEIFSQINNYCSTSISDTFDKRFPSISDVFFKNEKI